MAEPTETKGKRQPGPGFMKPVQPDAKLAEIIGIVVIPELVGPDAAEAIAAAIEAQSALDSHAWADGQTIRVRMGAHTGEALVAAVMAGIQAPVLAV